MLIETTTQYKAAPNKMAATLDAKRRSAAAEKNYTQEQQAVAHALHMQMASAWIRSRVYLTYRDTFVTVKIDKPTAADKLSKEVTAAEMHAQALCAGKIVTPQSIIYRFNP